MAGTGDWLVSWAAAAEDRTSGAARRPGRSRRAVLRLWVLLHAPALLRGTVGGRDVVAVIKMTTGCLAARRRTAATGRLGYGRPSGPVPAGRSI